MALRVTGTLYIPLEDFWNFVISRYKDLEPPVTLKLEKHQLCFQAGSVLEYMDLSDFWLYVHQEWLPFKGGEVRFGVPVESHSDIEIPLAFDSETPPENWSEPPKFLSDWRELHE